MTHCQSYDKAFEINQTSSQCTERSTATLWLRRNVASFTRGQHSEAEQ